MDFGVNFMDYFQNSLPHCVKLSRDHVTCFQNATGSSYGNVSRRVPGACRDSRGLAFWSLGESSCNFFINVKVRPTHQEREDVG